MNFVNTHINEWMILDKELMGENTLLVSCKELQSEKKYNWRFKHREEENIWTTDSNEKLIKITPNFYLVEGVKDELIYHLHRKPIKGYFETMKSIKNRSN